MAFIGVDPKSNEFVLTYKEEVKSYPGNIAGAIDLVNMCRDLGEYVNLSSDLNHPSDFPQIDPVAISILNGDRDYIPYESLQNTNKKLYSFTPPKGFGYDLPNVVRYGEGVLCGNKFTGVLWSSEYKTRPILERPEMLSGDSFTSIHTAWYLSVSGSKHHFAVDKVEGLLVDGAKEIDLKHTNMKEASMKEYYIAAGVYKKGNENVFKVVSSSQFEGKSGSGKAYVTLDPSGIKHTHHHAHVYKLSEDFKSATLVKDNTLECGSVGAPKTANLLYDDYLAVTAAIKELSVNKIEGGDMQSKLDSKRFQINQIVKYDDIKTCEQIKGVITGISGNEITIRVGKDCNVVDVTHIIKSYISKPPNIPEVKLGTKKDNEDYYVYVNKFQDSFPQANVADINKISAIAHEMTKLSVKRCNDVNMTEDKFNHLTDKLEAELTMILKKYPGIEVELGYEPRGAAIKLKMPSQLPQSDNIYVPEYSKTKFMKNTQGMQI